MFPIALPEAYIEAVCDDGGSVCDPFLGSGTTLIAAEKTGRICYGMEIDPKYCDVIIKRYADYADTSEDSIRATREKGPDSAPCGPRSGNRARVRPTARRRAKHG
jgi:site-specific DNA-methyltransferase (adenine-specific)